MRNFETRLTALEGRRAAIVPAPALDETDEAAKWDSFHSWFNTLAYNDWRHASLSLEELLAIAREDAAPKPEVWADQWDSRLACLRSQPVRVDYMSPAIAAREIEIRILERDQRIDAATAHSLRDNLQGYRLKDAEPLYQLPAPIVFDEAASLSSAREQCPRRETLPLEQQLAMMREDHRRERESRAEGSGMSPGLVAFTDRLHEVLEKELEQRISDQEASP